MLLANALLDKSFNLLFSYMKKLLTLTLILTALTASSQQRWDLRKCIDHAMANNITVRQAKAQAQLSVLQFEQSKMTRLPTLGGSLSGSYQHGLNENPTTGTLESANFLSGSLGVQAGYTIFNWGLRKNLIAANELNAIADQVGVERAQNDIALLVANAFLTIMLRNEQVNISRLQLNQSNAQLVNIRKLVNAGSQPELNAIQLEAQQARDTAALMQAQSLAQQAYITLKAYLNIDQSTPFEIVAPEVENIQVDNITDLQPEAVYSLALTNQPIQKITALRIQGAKKQVAAARAAMYPTVSAFAGLNTRFVNAKQPIVVTLPADSTGAYINVSGTKYNVMAPSRAIAGYVGVPLTRQLNTNFGQSIGLSINFPIFNQYTSRTQWLRSKVAVVQNELNDEQEKINLKTNIYNAYQNAFASLQKYNASLRTVEASQKAFDFSQKRYDIGLLGTLDFIITQGNLFRARVEALSNHYDYVFQMKVLEFYKGQGLKL